MASTNNHSAITYLVANYNNGKYIDDCIASLRMQTNPNWYCLIADDKSTDNSLELIRPLLNDKIRLIENECNVGKTATLIKLLDHAPTDIVGILDPDDALYPEATEAVLRAYQKHPHVGFIYTKCARFSTDLKVCLGSCYSRPISPYCTGLTTGAVGPLRTYRVSAYRLSAGYDTDMLYAEDRDIVYKMEEVADFLYVNQTLYKYRIVSTSQSHDLKKQRIGQQNHLRAYANALDRRRIVSVKRYCYLAYGFGRSFCIDSHWLVKVVAVIAILFTTPVVRFWNYRPSSGAENQGQRVHV